MKRHVAEHHVKVGTCLIKCFIPKRVCKGACVISVQQTDQQSPTPCLYLRLLSPKTFWHCICPVNSSPAAATIESHVWPSPFRATSFPWAWKAVTLYTLPAALTAILQLIIHEAFHLYTIYSSSGLCFLIQFSWSIFLEVYMLVVDVTGTFPWDSFSASIYTEINVLPQRKYCFVKLIISLDWESFFILIQCYVQPLYIVACWCVSTPGLAPHLPPSSWECSVLMPLC